MNEDTFVLISPEGLYATPCFKGGGFAPDKSANAVRDTDQLRYAYLFKNTDRTREPYKYALERGYQEIPAYQTTTLGEKP